MYKSTLSSLSNWYKYLDNILINKVKLKVSKFDKCLYYDNDFMMFVSTDDFMAAFKR